MSRSSSPICVWSYSPCSHRAVVSYVFAVLALVATGCGAGADAPSQTELARRSADPKAVEFLLGAQEAYEAGHYNGALVLVDSAAVHAPELADVPFLRARIFMTMLQYEEAVAAYEETLALDPGYPGVWFNLGNGAYQRGERQEALTYYRRERGVTETTDYQTQLGRVYADLGEIDSARWAYERAIAADSTNSTAWMWLGQLYEDAGAFDEALLHSGQGLALESENPNYRYVYGVQLLRSGDLEGAVDHLTQAVEGLPHHYAAHYNLGQALIGSGRAEEGARYLAQADTLLERGEDVTRWEGLVQANSHEPMLWVNYGNALAEAGRMEDAIEALLVAYSLEPRWLALQNNIANLYLSMGDTVSAVGRYEALLQIDPTQPDVLLNLGVVYALSGEYDEARATWEAALEHDPDHEEAKRYLMQLPGSPGDSLADPL